MESAAEKWARYRGARARADATRRALDIAIARHSEAARIERVALDDAHAAQRIEDTWPVKESA